MVDYILFWLSKTLAELIVVGSIAIIVIFIIVLFYIPTVIKQWRCKHLQYRETMACDAICRDCNKNLGFIGTIRDKDK
jgi:hypothetical protein